MSSVIAAVFYALPYVLAFVLAVAVIALGVLALSRPRMLAYPFVLVLLTVSGSTYGALDTSARSLYSRGAGVLFFSIFMWSILASLLWTRVAMGVQHRAAPASNLKPWFCAWAVLLLLHTLVGIALGESAADVLSAYGFSNIVWMGIFFLFLICAFHGQDELDELAKVILVVALARAVFGLVRWAAFGGDPVNAYANRHGLNLKLTFFDINDSLTCTLGMAIAAIKLFRPGQASDGRFYRLLCWAMLVLGGLCIGLSFRRTAWFGLLMAAAFVVAFLPKQRRWQSLLFGMPVIVAGLGYAAFKRLSQTKGAGGLDKLFFEFQGSATGPVSARQLELTFAWQDFVSHPIFGLGAWGRYGGSSQISWQQSDSAGAFLHSGVLHVALKSGLIGLVLLLGLYIAFFMHIARRRKTVEAKELPLFVAGAAGVLFTIPDMLIGTPIPQTRTMMVMGLCLALPYLAGGRLAPRGRAAWFQRVEYGAALPLSRP